MCLPDRKQQLEVKDAKSYVVSFDGNDLLAAIDIGMLEEDGLLASLDISERTPSEIYWSLLMLSPGAIEALSKDPIFTLTLAQPGHYVGDWRGCGQGHAERFVLEPGGKAYSLDELDTVPTLARFKFDS
ncbi:MAG: hypothetical protein K2X29_13760 [Candidatus Obscuribacterales bacterium]|nr:hypothetical protein [Candidatus Obscuribacterales bacterium]